MSCLNTNLPEYKALEEVFGNNAKTKIFIKRWQKEFKTDAFPTVEFLQNTMDLQNVKNKNKKNEFVDMLFANLISEGFIEQKGQNFFIKSIGKGNSTILRQKSYIKNYLTFNGLPSDMLNFRKLEDGIIVFINSSSFSVNDIIQKSKSKDLLNTGILLSHLKKIFPDVNITYISEREAEQLFLSVPLADRKVDDFAMVKSFYDPNTKTSYLIEERVDDETAIEEVMHPFIDAVHLDNNELFENLHNESSLNFPKLKEKIESDYTDKLGFTELDRKKELVTQSLARHFKQDYENKPTKTFLEKAKEFLQWFLDTIVNSLHKLINGKSVNKDSRQKDKLATPQVTPLKEKFRGKLIYAQSGSGKTTIADNANVIDGDLIIAKILGVKVKDIASKFKSLSKKEKIEASNKYEKAIDDLLEEGKTVITARTKSIEKADYIIYNPNEKVVSLRTSQKNRENAYLNREYTQSTIDTIEEFKEKNPNKNYIVLSDNQYLGNVLLDDSNFKIELANLQKIAEKNDKKLDKQLVKFIKKFGVTVEEFNDLKYRLGVDSLGATDILNKVIWLAQDRAIDTVPEEVAHMIVMLLGKHHKNIKQIYNGITGWSKYKSIYDKYMPIYNNEHKVKVEAIGKMIAEAIVQEYKYKNVSSSDKSLLQKAYELFKDFIKKINKILYVTPVTEYYKSIPYEYDSANAVKLAREILDGNVAMVDTKVDPGKVLVDYQKAIKSSPKIAKYVIDTFSKLGYKITGSLSIAKQGKIYRNKNQQIHDVDFVAGGTSQDLKKLDDFAKSIGGVPIHWGMPSTYFTTYSYFVPLPGYKIKNVERNENGGWVEEYDVISDTGKLIPKKEVINYVLGVDFFWRDKVPTDQFLEDSNVTTWQSVIEGKLAMSPYYKGNEVLFNRLKDQKDYNLFVPLKKGEPFKKEKHIYYQAKKVNKSQKVSRVKDLFKMIELIEELQKIKKGDTIDIFYDENDFSNMFPSGISAASELSDIANEYDINVEEYKYEEDAYGYTGLDINLETIHFDFIESLMGFKSNLVNEIKTSLSDLLQNEDIDIDMLYNMMFFEVGETTSNKLNEYHFLKKGDFSIKSIEDGNFQVAKSIVEGIMDSYSETADVAEETEVTGVEEISSTSTLSDIAKMLNTPDIIVDLSKRIDGDLQFSLSDQKEKQLNEIKKRANPLQKKIVDKLAGVDIANQFKSNSFIITNKKSTKDIVNITEDGVFINPITKKVYRGSSNIINGTELNSDLKQLNFDIAKDLNMMMEGLVSNTPLDVIKNDLIELSDSKYEKQLDSIYNTLAQIKIDATERNSILLPNVIIFDNSSRIDNQPIADKIDLLEITDSGKLKIIKMFTSSVDISTKRHKKTYEKPLDLNSDSHFYNDGNKKMSNHERHSIRMAMQRTILENMGYELDFETNSLKSIHIHVDIKTRNMVKGFSGVINLSQIRFHDYSIHNDKLTFLKEKTSKTTKQDDLLDEVEEVEEEEVGIEEYDNNYYEEDTGEEQILEEDTEIEDDIYVIENALDSYNSALLKKREVLDKIKDSLYSFRGKEQQKEYIQHALSTIAIVQHGGSYTEKKRLFTQLVRDANKEVKGFIEYLKDPKKISSDPKYITYVLNARRFAATFQGLYSIKNAIQLNDNLKSLLFELQSNLNELTGNFNEKKNLTDEAIDEYVINVIQTTTTQDLTREDAEGIIKYARDIGYGEYLSKDWSTSTDTIIRLMNKIFHNAKMEYHDEIDSKEEMIKLSASKVQKLSGENDRQKLFEYMLNDDGTYVHKINPKFYSMIQNLHLACLDEKGTPLQFVQIHNLPASQKDLDWNIALAKKKFERTQALQAEKLNGDGTYSDGKYYKYTDNFKYYRNKFEEWVELSNGYGFWQIKEGVSKRSELAYKTRFYREQEYESAIMIDGEYTGQTETKKKSFVKQENIELREDVDFLDNDGNLKPMLDPRYSKIMDAKTALEVAQKEFYLVYDKIYKEELNNYGPGVFRMMENRIPIIGNRINSELDDKGAFFSNMYAKMSRKVETFTSDGTKFKNVVLDEEGNMKQTLPMMYIGKTRDENRLSEVKQEIKTLKEEYKEGKVTVYEYDKKIKDLRGERDYLVAKPSTKELSKDLASSLLKFMAYAERYKTLDKVEDTLTAMLKVIEKRNYKPTSVKEKLGKFTKSGFVEQAPIKGQDSNTLAKAKAFMKMIFYDDEKFSKGMVEKITDQVINWTSLTYVSANPFGSFNNLIFGRISNYIEVAGGRFFDRKAYLRAEYEWNKKAIPSLLYRTGAAINKIKGVNYYDPEKSSNKFEALVDYFRMMDEKGDLRETASSLGEESYFKKFTNFLYIMQDGTEYNVQSKIGMAILMSTYVKNKTTGDIISLYDAYEFNLETKTPTLKEGYDTVVEKSKLTKDWIEKGIFDNTARYNLRNKIREVNKLIHGNYARDDRMVVQSHFLGKLFAQFHKWVVPAWNSRFQNEYYDENLGWMEGRFKSSWAFTKFIFGQVAQGNVMFGSYRDKFFKKYTGDDVLDADLTMTEQEYQRLENKIYGFKKTAAEIMFGMLILGLAAAVDMAMQDDDEEDEDGKRKSKNLFKAKDDKESYIAKRLINFGRYQLDRSFKDIATFLPFPFIGTSLTQTYQLFKSPIATTKTLGEIGGLIENLTWYPIGYYMSDSEEEFYADKDYYYQRGSRKGQSKLFKNFQDIFPIFRGYKKWTDFDSLVNFYIK